MLGSRPVDLATARNIGVDDTPIDIGRATEVQDEAQEDPREGQEQPTGAPDTPIGPRLTSRISKNDRLSPCLCSCGKLVKGRFAAGHDMRMLRIAREHLTEGRDLSDEQREYLEESGKIERVRARLAEEERKRREKDVRKGKK